MGTIVLPRVTADASEGTIGDNRSTKGDGDASEGTIGDNRSTKGDAGASEGTIGDNRSTKGDADASEGTIKGIRCPNVARHLGLVRTKGSCHFLRVL